MQTCFEGPWNLVVQIGLLFGIFMALLLGLGMPAVSRLFSADAGVLLVMSNLIPVCCCSCSIHSQDSVLS
jgi:hypothetical protein